MHLRLLMIVALFTAGCGSLGSPSEPVGAANGKAEQPKPKIKVFFHQILPVNEPPEPDLDDPFAQLPSVPIDDELAALQVKVLNDYFQPLGFKFINQGIDQTLSDEWYAREDKLTPEMYWYFRCGTRVTLPRRPSSSSKTASQVGKSCTSISSPPGPRGCLFAHQDCSASTPTTPITTAPSSAKRCCPSTPT